MQVLYYLKAASFVPQNKMNCLTTSNLYPHHLCKADTSSNWSEILQNPLIIETEPYFKVLTRFWTSKENFSAAVLALEHFVIHLLASIWGEKWFYLICTLLLYFITFNMEIFFIFSADCHVFVLSPGKASWGSNVEMEHIRKWITCTLVIQLCSKVKTF